MRVLALFDFDGTITTRDTLAEFIKFVVGKPKYYYGLGANFYLLLGYKLGFIPNYKAKEQLLVYFLKDWYCNDFQEITEQFTERIIGEMIKKEALERIRWHQKQGHKIVVVSASMECWILGWCKQMKIELIATKLAIKDNKLTGKFLTKNCYGKEKVRRIREKYNLNEFDLIYAYGDSKGDKDMLLLADKAFYKSFRN